MNSSKKDHGPFENITAKNQISENFHFSNQVTIPDKMCMGFKSLTTGNTFKISESVLKVAQNKYRDIFEDDDCQRVLNVDSIIDSSNTNFQGIFQALRVETANLVYFSAYIINRLYKVADIVMEC